MEAQNLHFMGAEGPMKTKYTDGFNPTKTRAHSRMSNAPLLVTEPFLPKTFPGDVSRGRLKTFRRNVFMSLELYPKKTHSEPS